MIQALILVCSVGLSAQDCQKDTAIDLFYAPEQQVGLAACFVHGMEYASQSGLVEAGTYPKIVCVEKRERAKP